MKTKGEILDWVQLQCFECFRTDKDGITESQLGALVASGEWINVKLGEANPRKGWDMDDPNCGEDEDEGSDWFTCWGTHIGLCDCCQRVSQQKLF